MRNLSVLFGICLCSALCAQTNMWYTPFRQTLFLDDFYKGVTVIDTIDLIVYYDTEFVLDTTKNIVIKERSILEIGRSISKYFNYKCFQLDSLFKEYPDISPNDAAKSILDYENTFPPSFYESFFYNWPKGKFSVVGRIAATDFKYEEDIPQIKWKLLDSATIIAGFHAQEAYCEFRGRFYDVWFTKDVPISIGPWKFNGLPGLILSVKDKEGYYLFRFAGISSPTVHHNCIWMPNYKFIPVTRQQYTEARKQITANAPLFQNNYSGNTGILIFPADDYQKRKLGNDFIER